MFPQTWESIYSRQITWVDEKTKCSYDATKLGFNRYLMIFMIMYLPSPGSSSIIAFHTCLKLAKTYYFGLCINAQNEYWHANMAEIQQTLVNCNQGINCKDSHFTDIQFLEEGGTEYQRI